MKEAGSTAGSTMSAGTSIASSECSDEAYVEYDGDSDSLFAVSEDQDYLNSSFYNVLDVNTIPGIIWCKYILYHVYCTCQHMYHLMKEMNRTIFAGVLSQNTCGD